MRVPHPNRAPLVGCPNVRPQAQHQALLEARRRQHTSAFARHYALREGIEAAINVLRLIAWLDGDELAPTRVSAFQRLYNAA